MWKYYINIYSYLETCFKCFQKLLATLLINVKQKNVAKGHMCSSDPCMLKLSKWSVDFNTNSVKYTHAQCWILIRRLTQEYWRPRILIEIGTTVSTLIALDESTRSRNFGHFARLLVDIDLSGNLPNEILVERYSYTFLCWHRLWEITFIMLFLQQYWSCSDQLYSLDDKIKKDKQSVGKKPFVSKYVVNNYDKQR